MTKKESQKEGTNTPDHVHMGISEVSVLLNDNDVKQALKKAKLESLSSSHSVKQHKTKQYKEASSESPERKKTKLSPCTSLDVHIKDAETTMTKSISYKVTSNQGIESEVLKGTQVNFDEFDHHIRRNSFLLNERSDLKFKDLYFIHESNPGGCLSIHCYQNDLDKLSTKEYEDFVEEFLNLVFEEEVPGQSRHILGVVHNAARNVPDLLEFMADKYPDLTVKRTMMGKSDIDTLKLHAFRQLVHSTYCAGTYRCGPLLQVSLVGAKSEECGGYFPDILDLLESNHLIKMMMPWGPKSCLEGILREKSDDGPILWSRPGEQVIPTVDLPKSSPKKKRGINELKNLMYLPRSGESREILIEDRTRCHADQVGDFLEKKTTAAVGVLKAVHAGEQCRTNRVVKEVTCFDPMNFEFLVEKLKLDLHEPPMTQCISWIDEARLNQLAREGVRFSTLRLRDNDVYFIPRKVIHQFKTVSAVTSVAWHVRLRPYYEHQQSTSMETTEENLCDGQNESVTISKKLSKKKSGKRKKAKNESTNVSSLKEDEGVGNGMGSQSQMSAIEASNLSHISQMDSNDISKSTLTIC